jgi:NADPH-dependent 7-cyano-7-deazaguanine reductase QueF-like protein
VAIQRSRPDFEEMTWKIFECTWVHSRGAPEVALELNVPIDSVYVAKSRVLKRLRAEVASLAEDYPLLAS